VCRVKKPHIFRPFEHDWTDSRCVFSVTVVVRRKAWMKLSGVLYSSENGTDRSYAQMQKLSKWKREDAGLGEWVGLSPREWVSKAKKSPSPPTLLLTTTRWVLLSPMGFCTFGYQPIPSLPTTFRDSELNMSQYSGSFTVASKQILLTSLTSSSRP
jgi:hypothetical protein